MKILITRPIDDAKETEALFNRAGFDCIIDPMIIIEYNKFTIEDLPQCVVATSSNAVRAAGNFNYDIPLVVIGEKTFQTAREHNWNRIITAKGDLISVEETVRNNFYPQDGKITYLAGDITYGNLADDLANCGFIVDTITAYRTKPVEELSAQTINALKSGDINAVTFFSGRTVEIFCNLAKIHNILVYLKNTNAFCLSSNIAQQLPSNIFGSINIAKQPKGESLLELIKNFRFNTK